MTPQLHLKRTACPLSGRRMGWAWTVIAANGQTARGWHDGTRDQAAVKAQAARDRLDALGHSGGRRLGRTADAALLRPEAAK